MSTDTSNKVLLLPSCHVVPSLMRDFLKKLSQAQASAKKINYKSMKNCLQLVVHSETKWIDENHI